MIAFSASVGCHEDIRPIGRNYPSPFATNPPLFFNKSGKSLRVHPENSFGISPGIPEFEYIKNIFFVGGGYSTKNNPETFGIDVFAY